MSSVISTAEPPAPLDETEQGRRPVWARVRAWSAAQWIAASIIIVAIALAGLVVRNVVVLVTRPDTHVPRSVSMEQATGVRFDRVAVVGDGGLVEVRYTALNVDKAQAFQEDSGLTPRLVSEDRAGGTSRVSVMRQGHNMRAGQTYYFIYQNTGGAVRSGERVTVVVGSHQLQHVPVR
jgi:hypothetical protein